MKPIYIFRLEVILDAGADNAVLQRSLLATIRSLRHYNECWFWSNLDETHRARALEWGLLHGMFDYRTVRWWDAHPERFKFRHKHEIGTWNQVVERWLDQLPLVQRANIVAAFEPLSDSQRGNTVWDTHRITCYHTRLSGGTRGEQ